MSMNSFKVPGPDGFQAFFFKEYWDIVGGEVWYIVRDAFAGGILDLRLVEALVVLIPKTKQPVRMKEFCPISLCNVLYKIITKVLVNRMKPFLEDLIGPMQGSFILRRGTIDNIIIA